MFAGFANVLEYSGFTALNECFFHGVSSFGRHIYYSEGDSHDRVHSVFPASTKPPFHKEGKHIAATRQGSFNETLLRKGGKVNGRGGPFVRLILQRNPPQERRERTWTGRTQSVWATFNETLLRKGGKERESPQTQGFRNPFNETLLRKGGKGKRWHVCKVGDPPSTKPSSGKEGKPPRAL